MEFDKPVWLLLGVPILALVAYAMWGETDKARFDRLEIGMSAAEVRDVIYPRQLQQFGATLAAEVAELEGAIPVPTILSFGRLMATAKRDLIYKPLTRSPHHRRAA